MLILIISFYSLKLDVIIYFTIIRKRNILSHTKKKIDFKKDVIETIYRQAGGQCSVPRCKNPTMGPFNNIEGAVNMGMACHIYSASENGPRGWGTMDENFISSEKNGIWCCTYHGNLIDKRKGEDYSVSTLFKWKELAEARVLKKMNDKPSSLGWVESIEFLSFFKGKVLPKISLSRYTLIYGENATGKTSLLEICASITNSKYAWRFLKTKFKAKIEYSTVDSFSKNILLSFDKNNLIREEDNVRCLLSPGDLEVIYMSRNDQIRFNDDEDDVDYLMRALNLDKSALYTLSEIGIKSIMPGEINFKPVLDDEDEFKYKDNGEEYLELFFTPEGENESVSFKLLSDSEKGKLLLDLLISKARETSKQRLTILLIEDLINNLTSDNFKQLIKILEKEEYQIIVSIPPSAIEGVLDFRESEKIKLKEIDDSNQWRLSIVG